MRYFLVDLALFLLPFAVFFAYAWYVNPKRVGAGNDPLRTPWFWLIVVALVLVIVGFLVTRFLIAPEHTGTYVPAAVGADGKLIPGHFEGADDGPAQVPPPQTPPPEPPPPPVPPPPVHP